MTGMEGLTGLGFDCNLCKLHLLTALTSLASRPTCTQLNLAKGSPMPRPWASGKHFRCLEAARGFASAPTARLHLTRATPNLVLRFPPPNHSKSTSSTRAARGNTAGSRKLGPSKLEALELQHGATAQVDSEALGIYLVLWWRKFTSRGTDLRLARV